MKGGGRKSCEGEKKMAYSPAKHHWGGVGVGWQGRLSFSNHFWGKRKRRDTKRRGETSDYRAACLLLTSHKRVPGALINKPPAYQWTGWGGGD